MNEVTKVKTTQGWRILTTDSEAQTKHYSNVMSYQEACAVLRKNKENGKRLRQLLKKKAGGYYVSPSEQKELLQLKRYAKND